MAAWKVQFGSLMPSHVVRIEPVQINAPIELVWRVLTDFSAYPEWNPFTVAIDSNLQVGDDLVLHIQQGRDKIVKRRFRLETIEPPHLIEWSLPKLGHRALLRAWRTQRLESLNADACTYETSDTFQGLFAGKIHKLQGAWVEKNFVRVAQALKDKCEALAAVQHAE